MTFHYLWFILLKCLHNRPGVILDNLFRNHGSCMSVIWVWLTAWTFFRSAEKRFSIVEKDIIGRLDASIDDHHFSCKFIAYRRWQTCLNSHGCHWYTIGKKRNEIIIPCPSHIKLTLQHKIEIMHNKLCK